MENSRDDMETAALDAHVAHATRMRDLLASGKFSDFVITCGSDTYKVHKAIVCQQCDFFERAEKFPVGLESDESKVDLPEDDPAIIKLLIQYLYEGDYEPKIGASETLYAALALSSKRSIDEAEYRFDFPHTCDERCGKQRGKYICPHHECSYWCQRGNCIDFQCETCAPKFQTDKSELLVHSKMYEMADKYGVQGLKDVSREKFSQLCTVNWDTDIFLEAMRHALTTTPDTDTGLRDILCQTVASHKKLLNKPSVEDVLEQHTTFLFSVLKQQAEELEQLKDSGSFSHSRVSHETNRLSRG